MTTLEEQCWELVKQWKEKSAMYRDDGKKLLDEDLPQSAAACRGIATAFGDAGNHLMEILKQTKGEV